MKGKERGKGGNEERKGEGRKDFDDYEHRVVVINPKKKCDIS